MCATALTVLVLVFLYRFEFSFTYCVNVAKIKDTTYMRNYHCIVLVIPCRQSSNVLFTSVGLVSNCKVPHNRISIVILKVRTLAFNALLYFLVFIVL